MLPLPVISSRALSVPHTQPTKIQSSIPPKGSINLEVIQSKASKNPMAGIFIAPISGITVTPARGPMDNEQGMARINIPMMPMIDALPLVGRFLHKVGGYHFQQ